MNAIITALLFIIAQTTTSPVGRWEHKEDKSEIEIQLIDGKYFGTLLTSENPHHIVGTEILRNIEYSENRWVGELYLYKSKRWVEVRLHLKDNILFLEYKNGFLAKKLHYYRLN